MKSPSSIPTTLASLAPFALAAILFAQWQVNPQAASNRVNNRVGGELYGNMGSVKYAAYQTNLLPSEARYATWKSGALPSEIAMNAAAVGPLAPNGVINYLPPPNAVQQAGRAPTPQLYNPAYKIDDRVDQGPLPTPGYGTIKYAPQSTALRPEQMPIPMITGAVPNAQLPTNQVTADVKPITPAPITTQINYQAPKTAGQMMLSAPPQQMGTIRYSGPTIPTTQSTQPSKN